MDELSVTSKGQVTIPEAVRQKPGIRAGSKVSFRVVGDRAEMAKVSAPIKSATSEFGMLRSIRKSAGGFRRRQPDVLQMSGVRGLDTNVLVRVLPR